MSKDAFMDEMEYQLSQMSREDIAVEKQRISYEQESYLLSLIETSSHRNSDAHDEFEREILSGIDYERFIDLKNDFLENQIDPNILGMAGQKDINAKLKNI